MTALRSLARLVPVVSFLFACAAPVSPAGDGGGDAPEVAPGEGDGSGGFDAGAGGDLPEAATPEDADVTPSPEPVSGADADAASPEVRDGADTSVDADGGSDGGGDAGEVDGDDAISEPEGDPGEADAGDAGADGDSTGDGEGGDAGEVGGGVDAGDAGGEDLEPEGPPLPEPPLPESCVPTKAFCLDEETLAPCGPDGKPEASIPCPFGGGCAGGECQLPATDHVAPSWKFTVHVATYDAGSFSVLPVEGAYAILGADAATPFQGTTGAGGKVVFEAKPGSPLPDPATVTVAKAGFRPRTFAGLEGNVAYLLLDPLGLVLPEAPPAAEVSGKATWPAKPAGAPTAIRCSATVPDVHTSAASVPSVFAATDGTWALDLPPGPRAIVCTGGTVGMTSFGSCSSDASCPAGSLCHVQKCKVFTPRALGVHTGLELAAGEIVPGVDVTVDHPFEALFVSRLESYPFPNADAFAHTALSIDLGADGVFALLGGTATATTAKPLVHSAVPSGIPLAGFGGVFSKSTGNFPLSLATRRDIPSPVSARAVLLGETGWAPSEIGDFAVMDLAAAGPSHAFVVGSGGHTARWNGASWTPFDAPTTDLLIAVAARGPNDAYASTPFGGLFRFDGVAWKKVSSVPLTSVRDLWMAPTGELYLAAAEDGTGVLSNGTFQVGPPTQSRAVGGTSADDVWFLSPVEAWHFDGDSWKEFPTGTTLGPLTVHAVAPDDVWSAGDGGLVLHWDGDEWKKKASPTTEQLLGVATGPADIVWFGGQGGTLLQHYGGGWNPDLPDGLADHDVRGLATLAGPGGPELLAVGSPFVPFGPILPTSEILSPSGSSSGLHVEWTADDDLATMTLLDFTDPAVSAGHWEVVLPGDATEVDLPDLSCLLGLTPTGLGPEAVVVRRFVLPGAPFGDLEFSWSDFDLADASYTTQVKSFAKSETDCP